MNPAADFSEILVHHGLLPVIRINARARIDKLFGLDAVVWNWGQRRVMQRE